MKKIFRKNQLVITALALMIAVAGYFSYMNNNMDDGKLQTAAEAANAEVSAGELEEDGIVLDRVRYVGLSTDFSECSRLEWEAYAHVTGENWPEDIYTIEQYEGGWREIPGTGIITKFDFRPSFI